MRAQQLVVIGQPEQKNCYDRQQQPIGNLGNEYQFNRAISQ